MVKVCFIVQKKWLNGKYFFPLLKRIMLKLKCYYFLFQMLSHKTLVMLLGCDPSLTPDKPLPIDLPQVRLDITLNQ